jgi:hypothetical protein
MIIWTIGNGQSGVNDTRARAATEATTEATTAAAVLLHTTASRRLPWDGPSGAAVTVCVDDTETCLALCYDPRGCNDPEATTPDLHTEGSPTMTSTTRTPWLPAAVTAAAAALRDGARRGGGDLDAMSIADLAELGGSLEDLLARLASWTHRAAPHVAALPGHHALRDDTGTVDPAGRCLQAADHLTQISTHLAAAQADAQAFHTAVAHLAPQGGD